MGWNDHVDWDLMSDFEFVADELFGNLDEDVVQLTAIVEKVACGEKLTVAEQARYDSEVVPMLARTEELREKQYFDYLMAKDD